MKHFESEYLGINSTQKQDISLGFCRGHVFRLKGRRGREKTKTKQKNSRIYNTVTLKNKL
jgi:hypothetical protein